MTAITETWSLDSLLTDEALRTSEFPIAKNKIFLSHAAVTALPRCVADAVCDYTRASCNDQQEFAGVLDVIRDTRRAAADLIKAQPNEIALLGPTSLGLSLFANGLPWNTGDEILCYLDDYPANVYPWLDLERAHGVKINYVKPDTPGHITPDLVSAHLTPRTRLVALASCHFLTGYRINVDAIGQLLHDRGILFSLDAIQTIGAFPTEMTHVDFMSADAHKWMLGPMAIGIVYVAEKHFDLLRPSLLGAWNVKSPNFITQPEISFHPSAQRYEPGVLNAAGVYGMKAALDMILALGIENIAARLITLKTHLVAGLKTRDFQILPPTVSENASAITTFHHPHIDTSALFKYLAQNNIVCSDRRDRQNNALLRLSPHFYNTTAEIDHTLALIDDFRA
ncbi:MAG: aminotransferase class V-fold PLP-dependent enzyme [Verrucomicrobiota bacterium]